GKQLRIVFLEKLHRNAHSSTLMRAHLVAADKAKIGIHRKVCSTFGTTLHLRRRTIGLLLPAPDAEFVQRSYSRTTSYASRCAGFCLSSPRSTRWLCRLIRGSIRFLIFAVCRGSCRFRSAFLPELSGDFLFSNFFNELLGDLLQ